MSCLVQREVIDLFNDMLQLHWRFLEIEESKEKITQRMKLEECIERFLYIASHDQKFFLPKTAEILKRTVYELPEFSAHKALLGFESLSQYANNLFTKPWRKEFRALKLYCGFFQYEIKTNLLSAEKLFEAMGYHRISDEILMLDGPICPDQVSNVSRDAMTAYVECKIMKTIYVELTAMGVPCTWQDVFRVREKYRGSAAQAIKQLSFEHQLSLKGRPYMLHTLGADNCYASTQLALPTMRSCADCSPHELGHQAASGTVGGGAYVGGMPLPLGQSNLMYSNISHASGENRNLTTSYPRTNYQESYGGAAIAHNHHQSHNHQNQHMSHSRSLDHYSQPSHLPLRHHSFDHQPQQACASAAHHSHPQNIYEIPYDNIDGISMGSSASYAVVPANGNVDPIYSCPMYNRSGNRCPLPYSISNQLSSSATYATPGAGYNNSVNHTNQFADMRNSYGNCYAATQVMTREELGDPVMYPPEGDDELISLHQRTPQLQQQQQMASQCHTNCISRDHFREKESVGERERYFSELQQRHDVRRLKSSGSNSGDMAMSMSSVPQIDLFSSGNNSKLYASIVPKAQRVKVTKLNSPEMILRNGDFENGDNNGHDSHKELNERNGNAGKYSTNGKSHRSKSSSHNHDYHRGYVQGEFVDSYDASSDRHMHTERSPTQLSKNKDGLGSFQSWDFVFKKLEKSGYNKDMGDGGDLAVQSLDLDALNLVNDSSSSGDKRRSSHNEATEAGPCSAGGAVHKSNGLEKSKTRDKASGTSSVHKDVKSSRSGKPKPLWKTKNDALDDISSSSYAKTVNGAATKEAKSESSHLQAASNAKKSANANRSSKTSGESVAAVEWSCRFCTYLNPIDKRICEVCCRTKDSTPDATVPNAPTCV